MHIIMDVDVDTIMNTMMTMNAVVDTNMVKITNVIAMKKDTSAIVMMKDTNVIATKKTIVTTRIIITEQRKGEWWRLWSNRLSSMSPHFICLILCTYIPKNSKVS